MDFIEVASVDDVAPGTAAVISVKGREIALVNVDGEFYALQNDCTHAGGPMGEGELDNGFELMCPLHGSVFDVRTGEVLGPPAGEPLETYETRVEDGAVLVGIDW